MAKKTKDSEKEEFKPTIIKENQLKKETTTVKVESSKSPTTAKKATTKKATTSKATSKRNTTKKDVKKEIVKKAKELKKATKKEEKEKAKKTSSRKSTKRATAKKLSNTKETKILDEEDIIVENESTNVEAKNSSKKIQFQSEYYDLPYMYNKTIVKVLAQTPKTLFIYWEISKNDRENLKKTYGENFFETTKPILIVFNDTLHYSFEVDINDFANSWYLHINDANCEYHVELGRRPIYNYISQNQEDTSSNTAYIPHYIYLTSSNEMVAPNNKILFNPNLRTIRFRNVKTGQVTEKDIRQFTFITNFGIFTIQDLYKYLYPNENFEFENVFIGNPSSRGGNSSGMFSSQFK